MYYNKCCIPNCRSKRGTPLHKFPKNADNRKKWLDSINCIELMTLDINKLLVCNEHFEKRFQSSSRRITVKAYPTLFTTGHLRKSQEQENRAPIDHDYAIPKKHMDHTYCKTTELPASTQKNEAFMDVTNTVPALSTSRLRRLENKVTLGNTIHDHNYGMSKRYMDHTYCQTAELPASIQKNKGFMDVTNTVAALTSSGLTELEDTIITKQDYTLKRHMMDNTQCKSPKLQKLNASSLENEERIDINSPADSTFISGLANKQIITVKKVPGKTSSVPKGKHSKQRLVPKKVCRKRTIPSVNQLTPNCHKLYKEFKKSRRQLFNVRAKRALDFSKNFEDKFKNMNAISKEFINMQLNMCTKPKKGRRFTLKEKLISLSIMKQSPKAYRFLQKIFILPSGTTLKKMTSELDVRTGINNQLFNVIKEEVGNWKDTKKLCTIMFDEMSLEPGLKYSDKEDSIHGFVELGEKSGNIADHALVFLVRGAVTKWQQPVAFYYTEGAVSASKLKVILKEVVTTIIRTGLIPVALVCDQGASFQSALKTMQHETRGDQIREGLTPDDTVHIGGMSLSIIFDPPHLIKGIRNNFLTKNIKMDGKISKWDDILDVYKTDCKHTKFRLLHKLNDEHVIPEKIKKMKVKNCVRVLSKSVSSALAYTADFSHYSDGRPVSKTILNTAQTVGFFDDLFDSVNGSTLDHKKSGGKSLRKAVTEKSIHLKFWKQAIVKLENMRFVNKDGSEKSVPSLKNWITTLKSYQRVWQVLSNKKVKVMRPRYMNSDPIENFFGRVRAYNFRNNDPTCHTFGSTFKSLLITGFIKFHSDSYNCEDDNCDQLIKVQSLFKRNEEVKHDVSNKKEDINVETDEIITDDLLIENLQVQAARERLDIHAKAYTVGWVIKKIFSKTNCDLCKEYLLSTESNDAVNKWIKKREYKTIKLKKLTYPTENAIRYFGYVVEETTGYLENNAQNEKLTANIKNILKTKYPCSFLDCEKEGCRIYEYFVNISTRLTIFNWCNIINRILKGTDLIRLDRTSLPNMQNKAFVKYKKKLKNKSFNK